MEMMPQGGVSERIEEEAGRGTVYTAPCICTYTHIRRVGIGTMVYKENILGSKK
jgi:hypothetical protein